MVEARSIRRNWGNPGNTTEMAQDYLCDRKSGRLFSDRVSDEQSA